MGEEHERFSDLSPRKKSVKTENYSDRNHMPHIMLEVKSTREWKTQKSELIEGFFFYPNFILNLLRNITKKKKRKKLKL